MKLQQLYSYVRQAIDDYQMIAAVSYTHLRAHET